MSIMTFSQIPSKNFKKITDHEKNENFDQTDLNASVFDIFEAFRGGI